MDGVLADTESEYFRLTGEHYDHNVPWPDQKRLEFHHKHPNFFRDLPWMPGSRFLIHYAFTMGSVGICSSVSKHLPEKCKEQKLEWLTSSDMLWRLHPVIITPPRANKGEHAKPGDILIDDYDLNIQRWIDAGGIGIKFTNALQAFDDLFPHLGSGGFTHVYAEAIEKQMAGLQNEKDS